MQQKKNNDINNIPVVTPTIILLTLIISIFSCNEVSDSSKSCYSNYNSITLLHDNIEREYIARVHGNVTDEILNNLIEGVKLDDGFAKFTDVQGGRKGNTNQWFAMVIMEGRTREVRRLWESQGLEISRLKRVRYGNVFLPANLKQGAYKELSKSEVNALEHQ